MLIRCVWAAGRFSSRVPDYFAHPAQLLYNLRLVKATVAQSVEQLIRNQ